MCVCVCMYVCVVSLQAKRALMTFQKRELYPHETSIIGAFAGGFTGKAKDVSPCRTDHCNVSATSASRSVRACVCVCVRA